MQLANAPLVVHAHGSKLPNLQLPRVLCPALESAV